MDGPSIPRGHAEVLVNRWGRKHLGTLIAGDTQETSSQQDYV